MLLMPPLIAESAAFLLLLLPLIAVSFAFFMLLQLQCADSAAFLLLLPLHFLCIFFAFCSVLLIRTSYAARAASDCRFRCFFAASAASDCRFLCLFHAFAASPCLRNASEMPYAKPAPPHSLAFSLHFAVFLLIWRSYAAYAASDCRFRNFLAASAV